VRLTDAHPGELLALRSMPADAGTEAQVRSLGLLPGVALRLVRRAPFRGPLLLEVEGRVIALGWKIASSLEVSRLPAPGTEAG